MRNKIESFGIGTGKIVYSTNDYEDIFCFSKAENIELFKSSGVVLFRGFGVTPIQMKAFSEKFSSSYIGDPTKTSFDSVDFVNFVDAEMNAISLHVEHGFSPFRPDAIWFCCKTPVQGGETLFADGVQIWKEMSKHTKQLFLDKKLKFDFESVEFDDLKNFLVLGETLDNCKPILDKIEGLSYQINEDSTLSCKYICSAVVKTKYENQDAFANSLSGPLANGLEIFEDGSKLPDEVADEIQKLYDKFTEEISWQAGDLVMIDNSRFMHGRREFKDNQREVFTTLTNLSLD
ncbi:MAG: TauD/TfdA family dioxygenase [Nostoc sp. NOS(2021)]|uniref:TauD/TfdA family dioxygenase n=1 Tax=Nostoc sp. NOS(2021) TaxID=2815407 RepID=UPI0025FC91BB|nr:TauD/TfdA family dioxygenase [Nostoc sp. NOS(2021)]MBN3897491.1 TauD/TfdA family dioxygenase [Nostoc sp. NOS(2021)]